MSQDVYMGSLPSGRRLDSPDDKGPIATFGPLVTATPEVVDTALRYWPQVDPDDYEIRGMRWRDKRTGETLRVTTARVLEGDDPRRGGVACFAVRGGKLVPLRRPGASEGESRPLGVVRGYEATGRERLPGPEIF